jgi:hypothetical protein
VKTRWIFFRKRTRAEGSSSTVRVSRLYRSEPELHPKLWGSLPAWRDDFHGLRGADGQPSGEQAHGEEAADAGSEAGAHHLLQVRTKALNDELRKTFVRWYPEMQSKPEKKAAYPPDLKCSPQITMRRSIVVCKQDGDRLPRTLGYVQSGSRVRVEGYSSKG